MEVVVAVSLPQSLLVPTPLLPPLLPCIPAISRLASATLKLEEGENLADPSH